MSDELNVWRDASDAASDCSIKWKPSAEKRAAAVIRDYGDKRYQQAIADVVDWLADGGQLRDFNGIIAKEITRRFGKDV